jgi:hypothetical protein
MSQAEAYRRHAADCVAVAESSKDPAIKLCMLQMADAWRRLAEQLENEAGAQGRPRNIVTSAEPGRE